MAPANPPGAPPGSVAAQFEQALALHQQGQLPAAAALYQAILEQAPAHFDALHLLGMIAAQSGDPARAVTLIERALALDSAPAAAHHHRALALRDLGRHAEALAGFEAALARDPAHLDGWLSHAETLQDLQRHAAAIRSYDQALALAPDQVQALFARGFLRQQLQQHAGALADYDRVLALQADFAGAIHNRALALQALQRHAEALAGYDRLLSLAPDHAPAHYGRGLALHGLQQLAAALASHERALALQPDFAEARLQRGRVLGHLGRPEEALAEYARLLAALPDHADALFEQGSTLQALGRHAQALQSYDRALAARPGFAEACNNRALVLLALQRPADALAACEQALALAPDFAQAHVNRGLALGVLARHAEALAGYERALQLQPDYAEAHANRGHELQALRRLPDALAAYDRALALEPRNPDYWFGRGAVLHLLERPEEALAAYEQVLALRPDHAVALANRGGVLRVLRRHAAAADSYARLLAVAPDYPYAPGNRLHVQLQGCIWDGHAAACAQLQAAVAAGRRADMPFSFLSVTAAAAAQRQCARLHGADAFPAQAPLWRGERYAHPRIRLAYVSGDLSFQPVSYLMAELLEGHDRARFEVIAIALRAPQPTAFDARIRGAFDRYIDVSALSELEQARVIRDQEVDIAVDLMGYTSLPAAGIFAHRPAPLQAAYLGYAGTLDTGYMDYLIADPVAIPPDLAAHYGEQVAHLPASFMPRDTTVLPAPGSTRAAAGLPERAFVFCCFNNAYKLNPPVFDVWMRLLRAVPGSVLWLTDPGDAPRANLLREAAGRGVAAERLVFAGKTAGIEEHLGRIALADLFLDTLPYNAHTTASDALWAGVPLLTCAGEAFASRVAASLLSAAGLPELITTSLADYEALATQLAQQPARLAALRGHLAQQRAAGALFDTARLRRHLESAYLTMHERQQQGLPPAAFSVPR